MSVTLRTPESEDHVVVGLGGELDLTNAGTTAAAVQNCTAGGRRVIVDLTSLEFIDCHALRALLRVQKLARVAGGDMLLAGPRGRVLRILNLTGLVDVFPVHASVATAAANGGRLTRGPGRRFAARPDGKDTVAWWPDG